MDTPLRPRRILIVDDEPEILRLLDGYLRSLNFEPLPTSLWTEALDLIMHNPPDLVLLDLQMPTVQGDSVLEFIRQQGHTLPVIVVSAHLNDEQKMEDLRWLGVKGFVPKPFRLNDLVATIHKALEQPAVTVTPSPPPPETPPTAQTDARSTPPASPPDAAVPEQAAYPALNDNITEATAVPAKPGSPPHPHDRRRRRHPSHRRRKPRHLRLYVVVALVCVVGSLVILLVEKLPAYLMSGSLEKLLEKSIQSEVNRQKQDVENLRNLKDLPKK